MKTKFRELYLRAGFSPTHMWEWQRVEEFAELIVAECAKVCEHNIIPNANMANKIYEHFELSQRAPINKQGLV